jgi:hypothetical protein
MSNDRAGAERERGRWQRRSEKKQRERRRLTKHGGSIKRVYIDAVRKRVRRLSSERE